MRYRPNHVTAANWNSVREFVRAAVMDTEPVSAEVAIDLMSVTSHYVIWATTTQSAPLDRGDLFYEALMGRYLKTRVSKVGSGAHQTLHSRLFRVANAVSEVNYNRKMGGRFAQDPRGYTVSELAEVQSWAASRKSAERRRNAKALIALSGGAGLWPKELLSLHGDDIIRHRDGSYTVRVSGRHPRSVPVLAMWVHLLDDINASFVPGEHVFFPGLAASSRISTFSSLHAGAHPAPLTQRLRDTWLQQQLPVLPLGVLMHFAGMRDITAFRRYLPTITSGDVARWFDAVRDPDAPAGPVSEGADR